MHELDFSKGQAAIAFRGAVPWHGLGNNIEQGDDLLTIQSKGGLDYEVKRAVARYDREIIDVDGSTAKLLTDDPSTHILYRSDTGSALSTVSPKYQIVQPREIIEFYRDLTESHGFELEVVGALKGGRKVWALANTHNAMSLRDNDKVKGYLLLATSYDGTMATQARFTAVRVVCNNTLTLADSQGKAEVVVPHSTKFDANKVKIDLKIGDAWENFSGAAEAMSGRIVTRDEVIKLFMDSYYGLSDVEQIKEFQADEKNAKSAEKFMARMTQALFESPGANLASARGTLWGALNAITFDVDHSKPARSSDNRLDGAWFGQGNAIKQRAYKRALAMVA